ncbi:hypothetical protein Aduo_014429 [Ancylostoma duodenale]
MIGKTLLCFLFLLSFTDSVHSFECNFIGEMLAHKANSTLLTSQRCQNEGACVTQVLDGYLTMGCLDSVKHWEHIALCFRAHSRKTACSYDQDVSVLF